MEIALNSIPVLSNDIIFRFEPNIKDGTIFIYHINNQKIHEGNKSLYSVFKLIDGKKTVESIIKEIEIQYSSESFEEIKNSVIEIFKYFLSEEIVYMRRGD
ncbi:hypothetical protein Y919_11045 [Caloranaerobacter azorensis H53214]|uniref:Pyrroloquinoline quinone biosynthesis protein n=1 Tax=Caloranaerobacter azorensis H53214 TaxID=1156417 RepID=A0A096DK23_9FIRM|nr:PqqD family peptide modification chaperone [Caloranaerobacter azorensis]KGG79611.1 hypothetical protein Y919_11045 [Caloranaerobacter azorensis H53214]